MGLCKKTDLNIEMEENETIHKHLYGSQENPELKNIH